MQANPSLNKMIAKAVLSAGSKSKLARALGVSPQSLNGWMTGFRVCVPEDRARIAAFAQEDALQELVRALLEKHAGTFRGEQLKAVLGKLPPATGEVSVGESAEAASPTFSRKIPYDFPRCIKRRVITNQSAKSPLNVARYMFC